jgi:hypothetical protein
MDLNPCNPHLADRNQYKGWVRGPWDPNDKVTNTDFVCEYGLVEDEVRCIRYYVPLAASESPITYTVLFENKADATAEATLVTITDELPGELDPATLEVVSSSHPEVLAVDVSDQTATFSFTGIELPPNVTPPEGEGYVEFTVTPRLGLFSGTEIRNDASIVFDFNPPIVTPEVVHEIRAIADLQATAAVDVDSLLTDSVATVTYTVVNEGPDNASNVVFMVSGGVGTQIISVTSSTANCSVELPDASCQVGGLWVGAGTDFTVRATRSSIGFLELDASFALDETEGDPGNSTFSTSVNVYGSVGIGRVGADMPLSSDLLPSYPNPFSGVTNLQFNVASRSSVEIAVFDVAGRRVASVVDDVLAAGRYSVLYEGRGLASGVYFVSARIGDYRGARKIVVVR